MSRITPSVAAYAQVIADAAMDRAAALRAAADTCGEPGQEAAAAAAETAASHAAWAGCFAWAARHHPVLLEHQGPAVPEAG